MAPALDLTFNIPELTALVIAVGKLVHMSRGNRGVLLEVKREQEAQRGQIQAFDKRIAGLEDAIHRGGNGTAGPVRRT